MPNFISEDQIEQALLQRLQHQLGYDVLNCHTSEPDDLNDGSNRADKRVVVFEDRVRNAATRLNPRIPGSAIDDALSIFLEKLTRCPLSPPTARSTL
ncbi:hypothetical protein BH18VER1_BH18VER1_09160 [soil metagenome]